MGSRRIVALHGVFTATGAAALVLQVVWQRVISLHAGVDLVSFTTVVAAFLAGLGIGSLAGGRLADRLGPLGAGRAFALANLALGAFSWVSVWLFYDLYESVSPSLASPVAKFAFNTVLLLVPTVLMGLSTPLVAKVAVTEVGRAGAVIGRLYALNTVGAAAGAAAAGWYLLGTYGFVATVRIAGALQIASAALVAFLFRRVTAEADEEGVRLTAEARSEPPEVVGFPPAERVWPWFALYGLTGAVALGFEVVFFRVIDTVMRSNSYSFAHVLSLYLVLFAAGAGIGARLTRRARRPDQWFLWLQLLVGVGAVAGLTALVRVAPHTPWAEAIRTYFAGEGFSVGFRNVDGTAHPEIVQVFIVAPLVVMALPVLAMGASFPFVQSVVATRAETLGRRTGTLLASNVAGNVAGTLVAGLVLVDRLGTAGTYRVLAALLAVPGVAAAARLARPAAHRAVAVGAVLVVMAVVVRACPSNLLLYASLHGTDTAGIDLAEDRSCAVALRHLPDGERELTVNGAAQNRYPFDDFHVLVGLTPALVHPHPRRAMALGLGIGATAYGLSSASTVERIDTVELCGGEIALLEGLRAEGTPELERFFTDPRQHLRVGDGRDFLLHSATAGDDRLDVVVVDTLRSHSAFSGNLYSTEFYRLVRERMAPGGILAQWEASPRVVNSATEVFPYVVQLSVGTYYGSTFLLASDRPIEFDRAAVLERLERSDPAAAYPTAGQAASIRQFFRDAVPGCVQAGHPPTPVPEDARNSDLHPRDEYFLNTSDTVPQRPPCPLGA